MMKNKKLLLLSSSLIIPLTFVWTFAFSCARLIESPDQKDLNNYIKKLSPKIKLDKESQKATTLASSINNEQLINDWFIGLPQSENEIEVTFISAKPLNNDKTTLKVIYKIKKGSFEKEYSFQETGFKKEEGLTFKDFVEKNSFKIQLQTTGAPVPSQPDAFQYEGGTAWSWYYQKQSDYVYDWYLMTNFHVLYKTISFEKGFNNPNDNDPDPILYEKLTEYLVDNFLTNLDIDNTFFNLSTYNFEENQYKSMLRINGKDGDNGIIKHEKFITRDMIKSIQLITDYKNKNFELFSKIDKNKNESIYNLDAGMIKITLDFKNNPEYLDSKYQRPNLIEQYKDNKDFYLKNKFDPNLSTGVSIAGNPGAKNQLMPINIKGSFNLEYNNLLIGSYMLNEIKGPFYWSDIQPSKGELGPGASGSAVYQLKFNNQTYDPDQKFNWWDIIPIGIYWGGRKNGDDYYETSFMPFIWSGKTNENVDLSYNVYDQFIASLQTFRKL